MQKHLYIKRSEFVKYVKTYGNYPYKTLSIKYDNYNMKSVLLRIYYTTGYKI